MLTLEEKRARHNERMRRYREGKDRSAEGKLYWQKNKEKILAKRRARPPLTDEEREKLRKYARDYARAHREKTRDYQLAWKRANRKRLSAAQSNRKRLKQEGIAGRTKPEICDVCGSRGAIKFDHCHQSGVFRGWLCHNCNVVLGYVRDDPNHLRKLILYLEMNGK